MVFHMSNNPVGSGMGSAGFVGQIMTFQTMVPAEGVLSVLLKVVFLQFLLPGFLAWAVSWFMRKKGWIKYGDMKLDV